ncbi:c-type cytochrome [Methylocystis heyeri]|uniref:C-type cytochrome n=1 Tax=Methylocystis heyeri TaxID=391905 RepID=A0A6B8K9P8_9HYPH|nr:cytochrome c [Methylocystis heyeri]QGM44447.1 c-type cytochrome [Methylocystis heyeri]
MKAIGSSVGGLFLSFIVAASAGAQTVDPAAGQRLAEADCAACHQVKPGSPPKNPASKAPSFTAVSRMPSTTALSIKVFLRTSHANMPNIVLTPEEIDSVAAYILSLSGK